MSTFKNYDPDCGGAVNLDAQIRSWLKVTRLMFDFVHTEQPEIFEVFLEKLTDRIKDDISSNSFRLNDVGLDNIMDDDSLLRNYEYLKELHLRLVMKYLPFSKDFPLSTEEVSIRWFDFCRVSSLVDVLGKDLAIKLYKDFVDLWGTELAKKGKQTISFKEGRETWVKGWASGGMEFGVVDLDEHMYLCKFNKCVSHESMKHVEDQELAHYVVCYPAPRIQRHTLENVRLRRSVTLFIGDFCDELRWDPHVHDEPEQPSHEFSQMIVPKER